MKKVYAVAGFLTEDNRKKMCDVSRKYGFCMEFFETAEEARGKVSDGEIIYCEDGSLLASMPQLKWCHSSAAGAGEFIKSGVFDDNKILLTNSSGAYGLAISEHIIMVTLMLMRRMPEYLDLTGRREWKQDLAIRSIMGSVVAVVGTGDLGRNAAKRYKALGAEKVIGFNRSGRASEYFDETYKIDSFETVMSGGLSSELDVLVLCIPGTQDTKGLLSAERIDLLSEKTFVINVGRGMVTDQDALIKALNEGRIAGAAIDVMYPEPLPADHPLWDARNCIVTPHISGDMGLKHSVDVTVDIFCENLKRYAEGRELINLVDIKAGY